MSRRPILYTERDGEELELELPTRWCICGACDGNGKTSRHVERDGGGFTSSEWAEEDDEFREDYLAGRYDRACDECDGTGKVLAVDTERLDADTLKAWQEQCRDDAEYDAICRAERRMGA